MKILFISDIHGITTNLDIVEKKINEKNIDKLVCLGDLLRYSFLNDIDEDSQKVLNFLTKHKDILICMRGNCDYLGETDFKIYDDIIRISVDNILMYLTHGNRYSLKNNTIFEENSILVYGHEHIPYIKKQNNMTYINVGSLSLPRGGAKATYAIYDNKTFTIYDTYDNIIDEIKL